MSDLDATIPVELVERAADEEACPQAIEWLRAEPRTFAELVDKNRHWFFWSTKLLNAERRAEYCRMVTPELAEYRRVVAPALAEFERVTAPALTEYRRVVAPALAEYERVTAPGWGEFQRVEATEIALKELGVRRLGKRLLVHRLARILVEQLGK